VLGHPELERQLFLQLLHVLFAGCWLGREHVIFVCAWPICHQLRRCLWRLGLDHPWRWQKVRPFASTCSLSSNQEKQALTLALLSRTLYVSGLAALFTMLLILGFLGLVPNRQSASLATGSIMLVWALCYQLTVGTVCYSLVAEISTRRLQIKTVVLGRIL